MSLQNFYQSLSKMFSNIEVKAAAALALGWLEYVLPTDTARHIAIWCLVLIALDTVTGAWACIVKGEALESRKLARLGTKILGYGSVVVVCAAATNALPSAKGMQEIAVCSVLGFVLATEGLSILENATKMGLPVPKKLKNALKGVKQEG